MEAFLDVNTSGSLVKCLSYAGQRLICEYLDAFP